MLLPWYIGSKDYNDAVTAGYLGHSIILALSMFNCMFYGDLMYRRINLSVYHSWGLGFRTWWGSQATIRMLANFSLWSFTGFFAVLALLDVPMLYQVLGYVAMAVGWI